MRRTSSISRPKASSTCPLSRSRSAAAVWAATSSGFSAARARTAAGSRSVGASQQLDLAETGLSVQIGRGLVEQRSVGGGRRVEVAALDGLVRLVVARVLRRLFHRLLVDLPAAHPAVHAVLCRDPQQLVEETPHLGLGQRALEQRDRLALHDREDRGDALHLERLAEARVGVEVDLGEHPAAAIGMCASRSSTGLSCLHGPHQSAQKSMTTGTVIEVSMTLAWKSASVTSMTTPGPGRRPGPVLARSPRRSRGGPGCQRGEVDGTVGVEARLAHAPIIAQPASGDCTTAPRGTASTVTSG